MRRVSLFVWRELVSVAAAILETSTALFSVELLRRTLDLDSLELLVFEMVCLPTQRLEVLSSHFVFMNRHARFVENSTHLFLLGITHSTYGISEWRLFSH